MESKPQTFLNFKVLFGEWGRVPGRQSAVLEIGPSRAVHGHNHTDHAM
jgi:hypothetical protein